MDLKWNWLPTFPEKNVVSNQFGFDTQNEGGRFVEFFSSFVGDQVTPHFPKNKRMKFEVVSDSTYETLEDERLFIEWFFRRDHYFSRDLQSTVPGDYYLNGL